MLSKKAHGLLNILIRKEEMKKIYIEPSVKAVEIKLAHLMVMSDETTGTKLDPTEETSTMDSFDVEFEEE